MVRLSVWRVGRRSSRTCSPSRRVRQELGGSAGVDRPAIGERAPALRGRIARANEQAVDDAEHRHLALDETSGCAVHQHSVSEVHCAIDGIERSGQLGALGTESLFPAEESDAG